MVHPCRLTSAGGCQIPKNPSLERKLPPAWTSKSRGVTSPSLLPGGLSGRAALRVGLTGEVPMAATPRELTTLPGPSGPHDELHFTKKLRHKEAASQAELGCVQLIPPKYPESLKPSDSTSVSPAPHHKLPPGLGQDSILMTRSPNPAN